MDYPLSNIDKSKQVWFLKFITIISLLILVGRLIELQLIRGKYFRTLAEGNRVRRVSISAPRGKIIARGGEILVDNKEVKRKIIFDPDLGYRKVEPTRDSEDGYEICEWEREYKIGVFAAHITGYVGEINSEEVGKVRAQCPSKGIRNLGSLVGRSGLEEVYDCSLSGVDGEVMIEVDAQGRRVRILGYRPPVPGEDLRTTIDFGLQDKVAGEMKDLRGAIIISDPGGEILSLYSSPSFDPNVFVNGDTTQINTILNNKNLPLFNRAIGGIFHPGSVFKPVVAIAALEEGLIDESYRFEDPGVLVIDTMYGIFQYSNWYFTQYGAKEGLISLPRAIARSTDTFFYKLGEILGPDKLNFWANRFGLGSTTKLDLPGEISGLIPSPEWKLKLKQEKWFLGNTYHMSIGQGDLAVTPAGITRGSLVLATGGLLCPLRIVKGEICEDLKINKDNINLVKNGMVQACKSGGTGYTFFDFYEKSQEKVEVACKTGTAEVSTDGKTHAWFVVFAPAENPEIIATILVEEGGEGSKVAGPIARNIFNYWFKIP